MAEYAVRFGRDAHARLCFDICEMAAAKFTAFTALQMFHPEIL
jgi:hypothetical protein